MSQSLEAYIERIRTSPVSDFYSSRWKSITDPTLLPTISRRDLIETPLSLRRYERRSGIVKVVWDASIPFLSEWSFTSIAEEELGLRAARPLIFLSDPHEAIEKAMWCYQHDMVPLVEERSSEVTLYAARKFRCDALITDPSSLPRVLPYLKGKSDPLSSMTIISDSFEPEVLLPYAHYARKIDLVFSFPETGALARAVLSEDPLFTVLPNCIVEYLDDYLVVTKNAPLTTPVIRYRTNIPAHCLKFSEGEGVIRDSSNRV